MFVGADTMISWMPEVFGAFVYVVTFAWGNCLVRTLEVEMEELFLKFAKLSGLLFYSF